MPRYVKDPWAKKSREGWKIFENIVNTTVKVGAVAYNEHKKSKKKQVSTPSLPPSSSAHYPTTISNTPASSPQAENGSFTTGGCLIVLVGGIVGFLILLSTDGSFGGYVGLGVAIGLSAAIASIISRNSKKTTETSTEEITQKTQYVPSAKLVKSISDEILGGQDYSEIDLSNLTQAERRVTLRAGFAAAVNKIKDQGLLIPDAENRMNTFAGYYSLNDHDLQGGAFRTMTKLLVVNDLLEGKLPNRFYVNGGLPINLQSGESLIWAETKAHYYEERVHRSTVGRTAGLSIKIANGLYYRTGAFKGTPVVTREMTYVDTGVIYITNKNIYFQSEQKALRIPYNKIIGYIPYEDGIGIQRDGASSKPVFIKGIDGWLAYNIVTNINNIRKVKPQTQTPEVPVNPDEISETRGNVDGESLPEPYVIGNLVNEKKYDEAIALGEKLLKEQPDSALVHVNLMDAYFKIREQDSINLLKSTLHAKMAMICGHNTGYVQHRLVVNLESMLLIENAIQVCEIIQNPSFHFSKHGAGTKEEYAKRIERLQKKLPKSNPVDYTLYFSESDIAQTFERIKLNDEEEARQAEESQRRIRELEAELKNLMK